MGHLVLTRKRGERIRIGNVWVMIGNIGVDKVRLIIDAPREVQILREELVPEAERPAKVEVET